MSNSSAFWPKQQQFIGRPEMQTQLHGLPRLSHISHPLLSIRALRQPHPSALTSKIITEWNICNWLKSMDGNCSCQKTLPRRVNLKLQVSLPLCRYNRTTRNSMKRYSTSTYLILSSQMIRCVRIFCPLTFTMLMFSLFQTPRPCMS